MNEPPTGAGPAPSGPDPSELVGQDGAAVADGFRRLWTPHR
ncbi:MAG: HIT family hydrolase, partial [Pseudonocardiales bacterium]|nr:HIT family hydrolase [Pseudonocardiales bacterium]